MDKMIPETAVESPSAWYGRELVRSDAWIEEFSEAEIAELESASRKLLTSGRSLSELTREDFAMPILDGRARAWLRELDQGRGFLLLRGLPVQRWGLELTQVAYIGLGLQMGGFGSQNAAGDLLGHVRDTGEDPDDPSVRLYKTSRAQGFHTDGADVIALLCLQGAKSGGESRIASSTMVFNEVLRRRPELAPRMFEPFHFDRNEEQAEGEDPSFALPLCWFDGACLGMFYIGWYIRDAQRHARVPRLTAEEHQLLDLIDQVADEIALDMDFLPGDIQLLKNSAILHGRRAYEDWPEPERRRHLLRLWINASAEIRAQNLVRDVPVKKGVTSDAELL